MSKSLAEHLDATHQLICLPLSLLTSPVIPHFYPSVILKYLIHTLGASVLNTLTVRRTPWSLYTSSDHETLPGHLVTEGIGERETHPAVVVFFVCGFCFTFFLSLRIWPKLWFEIFFRAQSLFFLMPVQCRTPPPTVHDDKQHWLALCNASASEEFTCVIWSCWLCQG